MREIKFRAWNSAEQRMYYNVGIEPHAGKYCVIDEDGVIYDMYGSAPALMQFTGLKDRHGVDVYEGDIIAGRHAFCEYLIDVHRAVEYEHGTWNYSHAVSAGEPEEKWEVIGNLYEHPDLISSEELPE